MLKRYGVINHGPSFTVHLEVRHCLPSPFCTFSIFLRHHRPVRAVLGEQVGLYHTMSGFLCKLVVEKCSRSNGPRPIFPARGWRPLWSRQVDYKAPLPAGHHVLCRASLESTDGRKAWVRAEVLPHPGGRPYAVGRALFVIPRDRM